MAKLTLVYGMRLLPAGEVAELGNGGVKLRNGRELVVPLHFLEGSKDEVQKQLEQSVEAFFELYPEI